MCLPDFSKLMMRHAVLIHNRGFTLIHEGFWSQFSLRLFMTADQNMMCLKKGVVMYHHLLHHNCFPEDMALVWLLEIKGICVAGKQPGRGLLALMRCYVYLEADNYEQALKDANTTLAFPPEFIRASDLKLWPRACAAVSRSLELLQVRAWSPDLARIWFNICLETSFPSCSRGCESLSSVAYLMLLHLQSLHTTSYMMDYYHLANKCIGFCLNNTLLESADIRIT